MDSNTVKDEFSKDLVATKARNSKQVTITLTAIEVFAIVSAIQATNSACSQLGTMGECAVAVAKKMHDCLDPDSLLSLHLTEGWELEGVSSDD